MSKPNTKFDLTVEDMELIEGALRAYIPTRPAAELAANDAPETSHKIASLLGRLHNQKNFYRPRNTTYIGG